MPFLTEERLASSRNLRSPSPPIRRSASTERGSVVRSKVKPETLDNQPIIRAPFPARVPATKSLATTQMNPSNDTNSRIQVNNNNYNNVTSRPYNNSHDSTRQDYISEALYSIQKLSFKKVQQEHEDEQFKQALNIRQGGIRKTKPESTKAKTKQHQVPPRMQKSEAMTTFLSDLDFGERMEEASKSDYSEPESEHVHLGSPLQGALEMRKPRKNFFSRNSQNHEPR